jgi:hypothetical protein
MTFECVDSRIQEAKNSRSQEWSDAKLGARAFREHAGCVCYHDRRPIIVGSPRILEFSAS